MTNTTSTERTLPTVRVERTPLAMILAEREHDDAVRAAWFAAQARISACQI